MIDLVVGYAKGYTASQIRPFLRSLRDSEYEGEVLLFVELGAVPEALKWGAEAALIPRSNMKVHSARFLCLQDVLQKRKFEGVLLADTRDIIFQKNIAASLPSDGLHAFQEDRSMTIGTCPYNSNWIQLGYGNEVLEAMKDFPISCVGTVCGDMLSVRNYLNLLCDEVKRIQPRTSHPQDQAAHNYIIHHKIKSFLWDNEGQEVYTVGYIPRETVRIQNNKIVNRLGYVPAVIHQYDRHSNLTALVEGKYK